MNIACNNEVYRVTEVPAGFVVTLPDRSKKILKASPDNGQEMTFWFVKVFPWSEELAKALGEKIMQVWVPA